MHIVQTDPETRKLPFALFNIKKVLAINTPHVAINLAIEESGINRTVVNEIKSMLTTNRLIQVMFVHSVEFSLPCFRVYGWVRCFTGKLTLES